MKNSEIISLKKEEEKKKSSSMHVRAHCMNFYDFFLWFVLHIVILYSAVSFLHGVSSYKIFIIIYIQPREY